MIFTAWSGIAWLRRWHAGLSAGLFHALSTPCSVCWAVEVVFLICRRVCRDGIAAFFGAAFFAAHPMLVGTVAEVGGRNNLLAGALGLTAVWI